MKRKILILAPLFLLFLVLLAPAKIISHFIPSNAPISFVGLNGSLWSGTINQLVTPQINLTNIDYQLNPLTIVLAKLSVRLFINDDKISGNLKVKLSSDYATEQTIENANLNINSQFLSQYLPLANAQISGDIMTRDLNLIIANQKPELIQGELRWNQAMVSINGKDWALGDLALKVETNQQSGEINARILPTQNALDIKGDIKLTKNGIVEFIGSIATDSEQQLYQTLALFNNGKPANGRLPIKFRQKLL